MTILSAFLSLSLAASPLVTIGTDEIIPITPGMTWQYNMTQEVGYGVRLSELQPDVDGKFRDSVSYRLNRKEVDGQRLLEFEMHRAGRRTNTDLVTVDEHGIVCVARIDPDGKLTKLPTPQTLVAAPLETGVEWDFDGEVEGARVHQHYRVLGQEDVQVPAGKFHAFHIQGQQTTPNTITIDRWFVKGTGIIKDVTTSETEDGDLIRRISLELKEKPRPAPRPEIKPIQIPKKLTVSLGKEPIGEESVEFVASAPKICARWQGHGLREKAKIRVVWIAEEVPGTAPPETMIDEANTTATASDSHGVFTLARPEKGWTPGVYRVEFYADGDLADALKLKIANVSFF